MAMAWDEESLIQSLIQIGFKPDLRWTDFDASEEPHFSKKLKNMPLQWPILYDCIENGDLVPETYEVYCPSLHDPKINRYKKELPKVSWQKEESKWDSDSD